MKKTIDKFVYLIVVAAVISGIYSIYVWSQRGEFELLIIDRINRTLCMCIIEKETLLCFYLWH